MRWLGIDQSLQSSGVVLLEDNEVIFFEKLSSSKTVDVYDRCFDISSRLVKIVDDVYPDYVAIEGLAFGMRGSATRDLAGLQFQIIIQLRHASKFRAIDVISPLSLKKFATGSGKSKKEAMIGALPESVRDMFVGRGFKKTTGLADLSDAFWLAKYIQHKYKNKTA